MDFDLYPGSGSEVTMNSALNKLKSVVESSTGVTILGTTYNTMPGTFQSQINKVATDAPPTEKGTLINVCLFVEL